MECVKETQPKIIRKVQYIPRDIIQDILLRLPTKSLLRFKTVCKNWCTMISQPDFEELQLQRCLSKILIVERSPRINVAYKFEDKGMRLRKFAADLQFGHGNFLAAKQSCNSLILLRNDGLMCVYDAVSHKKLSLPPIPASEKSSIAGCSLVYDALINMYKVVVFFNNRSGWVESLSDVMLESCYIYRFNSDLTLSDNENWRTLAFPFQQKILLCSSLVVVGGMLYWIARTHTRLCQDFIQSMDIKTEEFMEIIEVPRPKDSWSSELFEMKGSLCLMNEAFYNKLEILILKNSGLQGSRGWNKQHKFFVSFMCIPENLYIFDFGVAMESCKATYLLVSYNFQLCWYNMNTEELKPIALDHSDSLNRFWVLSL